MYVLEFHDQGVDNALLGSLLVRIGRRYSSVESPYVVEMRLRSILHDPWRRVYALHDGELVAVWARDPDSTIRYVAREPAYESVSQLPFVNPAVTRLVAGQFGTDANSLEEGAAWAARQLTGEIATAVILDSEGVYAAWEKGDVEPRLIARRPR